MPSREMPIAMIILGAYLLLAACAPEPTPSPTAVAQAPSPIQAVTATVRAPSPTQEATPTAQAKEKPSSQPKPPEVGDMAFDFTLQDLQGNQISLSDFRGQAVMLNFWASWCGHCRTEIPYMIDLYEAKHDQGFEIVAVNLREDPDSVKKFAQELGMPFPILLDRDGRIGSAYYVRGIPTSIFIDTEGVIRDVHVGTLTESALQDYVADLMS